MKHIITSALGLFMIFSCSLIYCSEKNPNTSPRLRLNQIKIEDRNKTKVVEPHPKLLNNIQSVPVRKTTH